MNRRPEDIRIFISQLQPDDFEKVPPNLSMRELYRRIYDWHKKNEQMVRATATDPVGYQNRYLHLVKDLPNPDQATEADIYFVCLEVIVDYMEWAEHKQDGHGVKTGAYAHFIAEKFGGGFRNLHDLAKDSKLYTKYQPGGKWLRRYL